MAEHQAPDVPELEARIKRLERALREALVAIDDLASIVAMHPEERPSVQSVVEHVAHARGSLEKAVEEAAGQRRGARKAA